MKNRETDPRVRKGRDKSETGTWNDQNPRKANREIEKREMENREKDLEIEGVGINARQVPGEILKGVTKKFHEG